MPEYQAQIYPNTAENPALADADGKRKGIAVCFSGGGSRALTCAWGQLIGLHVLKNAAGKPLIDEVRYISSVSGGSWASVLYTFLPESVSYADFLGGNYHPSQLYIDQPIPGGLNVNDMGTEALGRIPQNFANLFELDPLKNIIVDFITITLLKDIPLSRSAKWLWMYIVGKNVLNDFKLYHYHFSFLQSRDITPWQYPEAKFFSLSRDYADNHIFSLPEAPSDDDFVYARTGADGQPAGPILIINTNIVGKDCPHVLMSAPIQIPTQVSAMTAGINGANPCAADDLGGGSVESFAFTSKLIAQTAAGRINADFPRRYELADITACSSAFYAAALADPLEAAIAALLAYSDTKLHGHFSSFLKGAGQIVLADIRSKLTALDAELKSLSKEDLLQSLVPQYNYWPVAQAGEGPAANLNTEFTDGGDLENTGVAGLLAQVQAGVGNIMVFVNGSEVLEIRNKQIIAAPQMAPLFGVAYDSIHGQFKNYLPNGVNPFTGETDPTGFLQVFDNRNGEFDALRQDLFNSNNPVNPHDPSVCLSDYDPAFSLQTLAVVANKLLGITRPCQVKVLWVQNAKVDHWQQQIADQGLKDKITNGQQQGGLSEFADFPYYDTFKKIHQNAAETNVLAQLWAWNVSDPDSPLSKQITAFFAGAN